MKNNLILKSLTMIVLGLSTACATSVTWLDDGEVVHITKPSETKQTIRGKSINSNAKETLKVTLATGEEVTLIGGVYIKSKEPDDILDWAQGNGYEAKKDKYTKSAVHIECTATESVNVANSVAKLNGVSTAAPKYRKNLVSK